MTPKLLGIQSNISSKLHELETLNLVHSFFLEKPSGRANNFNQKGRGLGHVTPKFVANDPKYLENYLGSSFACGMPTGCINNFPQRDVAGHVAPKFLAYD